MFGGRMGLSLCHLWWQVGLAWAGEGRLSCSGRGSSEQGWLVHMSLGSVVYFFKAGVCFLISKALLCSFPNKA